MPVNGFSVGRDISVDIYGQNGSIVRFNTITAFDRKQMTSKVTIKGLDGVVRFLELPEGWDGTLSVERADSAVDDYFCQLESNYYAGLNIKSAQITETITEPTGATTQYRYIGVQFKLDDAGAWKSDAAVPQKISFCASKRIKVL